MVTRSLCLLLVVAALIQVNEGTPSIMIIAQYVPKFISLSVKLAKVVGNGTHQILSTQNQIKTIVDSAETNVKKHLSELNRFIAETKTKSAQKGIDINPCLAEEEHGIQRIYMKIMEKCRIQEGVKHLYTYAMQLAKEELSISIRTKWCIIKNSSDGDKLKICFDDKIEDVESKIVEFQSKMSTTLPKAIEFSSGCTKQYSKDLKEAIDRVRSTFKICVDDISL